VTVIVARHALELSRLAVLFDVVDATRVLFERTLALGQEFVRLGSSRSAIEIEAI